MKRSYRTTTALAASLSLMMPNLAPLASAQQANEALFCLDGDTPPCDGDANQAGMPLLKLEPEVIRQLAESGEIDAATAAQSGLDLATLLSGDDEAILQALTAARGGESAAPAAAEAGADAEAAAAEQAETGAEAAAAEQAEADAEAAAAEQAEADAEAAAAEQAEADAEAAAAEQAEADAEAAAAEQAEADAEAAAAEQAEADAEAAAAEQAEADAEAAAAEQAEADAEAAAAEQAEVDAEAAAAEQAEADAEAAAAERAEADAEAAAAEQAEADAEAAAAEQAEADAAEQAEAEAAATDEGEVAEDTATDDADSRAAIEAEVAERARAAAKAEAEAEAEAESEAETDAEVTADSADAEAEAESDIDPTTQEPQAPVAAAAQDEGEGEPAEVVEESIDDTNSRQSDEEFETSVQSSAPADASAEAEADAEADADETAEAEEKKDGMSDFQKALLLGIGAVAVGSLLKNGQQVVSNTGDRVVVEGEDGLTIYRDDDALLRQPGADLRTETFNDGSSRTTLTRDDNTKVVTIRDAQGRVLRRSRIFADGTEVELFDDLAQSDPVDMRALREIEPAPVTLSAAESDRAALIEALRAEAAVDTGRNYSLRQVREIEEVRSLVPAIDLDTLTFATGSAALRPEQAATLVDLGLAIEDRLAENPREVFLIEGHTDAVGNNAYNLALSDRRAETVALALTETFDIPPENLVVQGYGERFLKVETEGDVQANRRATVRRITPLLQQVASAN